jgi:TonB family protein
MLKFFFTSSLAVSLCILLLGSSNGIAQNSSPSLAPQMPSSPKELMALAARLNGIKSPDVGPWHLKASYTIFDPNGQPSYQGTYEESWINPTKFKRTIMQGSFIQTDFGTGSGIVRSGVKEQRSSYLEQMLQSLAAPFPSVQAIEHSEFQKNDRTVNGEKSVCLQFSNLQNGMIYCLDPKEPALHTYYSIGVSIEVHHSRILTFNQHYVAGDLTIFRSGKLALMAHVDVLEALPAQNDADFTPPADATPVHRRITISTGVALGLLKYSPAPRYPTEAKAAGVAGTVVLHAVIGVDGKITDLSVVQGPQELQQAALDAVETWRYEPYVLNGNKVEVQTQINVAFKK